MKNNAFLFFLTRGTRSNLGFFLFKAQWQWTWHKPHPKTTTGRITSVMSLVLLKCLRPKLLLRAMLIFHFLRAFSYFLIGKMLTPLLSSQEFILNSIQCISKLIGWEELYWPWWISASQNLQLLHLVLVSSTVWFSNKQTKYPRYSHNWSELYTEKSMNIFRNSQFVRSTDKFYLVWFNFKYDHLIHWNGKI